jgi:chromate transporter
MGSRRETLRKGKILEVGIKSSASLRALLLYFFKLGAIGFGGPIALVASMQKHLVDENEWFSQETFKEGVALSQMAPGPFATQMAIYLGWANSGVLGATLVGSAFVIPSFIMVVILAMLYMRFGSLPIIQKLFHGIGPAVIAIVCLGAYKLSKKNLGRRWELWIVALINAIAVVATESENIWIFLVSGFAILALKWKGQARIHLLSIFPAMLVTGIHGESNDQTVKAIFLFFAKAGAFVFGSGLAIVPFLHGGVVLENKWLTEAQFLDAVAVAMITPGPVVITVAFIGFLVAGFVGAVAAAFGVFLPCYLFTVIPAPYFSKASKNILLKEFVSGITSAAVGAIIGAAIIIGKRSLIDIPTALIFAIALAGIVYVKKVPEPLWIVFAGVAGVLMA